MADNNTIILAGMVDGTVDWVTQDGKEIGLFIQGTTRQTRCVVRGPSVERLVEKQLLSKGQGVSASGMLTARCARINGADVTEAVCDADWVRTRDRLQRVQSVLYATARGVVMYWDEKTLQLKTFLNYTEPGMPKQLTCSVFMNNWFAGLQPDKRETLKAAIRKGREFVAPSKVETSQYVSATNGLVPVLQLLPVDFRLLG